MKPELEKGLEQRVRIKEEKYTACPYCNAEAKRVYSKYTIDGTDLECDCSQWKLLTDEIGEKRFKRIEKLALPLPSKKWFS